MNWSSVATVLVLALMTAGCTQTSTYGEPASPGFRAPLLRIDLNRTDDSTLVYVLVTNQDATKSFTTGYGNFHLLDADGLIHENDYTTAYWTHEGFPSLIKINPGETAAGYLAFDSCGCKPPYTLSYEHPAGVTKLPIATATT